MPPGTSIGCDIVCVQRVARVYAARSERFLRRFLHVNELRAFAQTVSSGDASSAAQWLAGRWAAKEALFKAMRAVELECSSAQQRQPFPFAHIEITSGTRAPPRVMLHGDAQRTASALRTARHCVSISHERSFAMATALIER